jgi:hypothetical protein
MPRREFGDSSSVIEEHRICENDDRAGPLRGNRGEGPVDLGGAAYRQGLELYA